MVTKVINVSRRRRWLVRLKAVSTTIHPEDAIASAGDRHGRTLVVATVQNDRGHAGRSERPERLTLVTTLGTHRVCRAIEAATNVQWCQAWLRHHGGQ